MNNYLHNPNSYIMAGVLLYTALAIAVVLMVAK